MMFEVEVGGRARSVAIEPTGGTGFRITIDGQPHLVDAVRVGEFGLSIIAAGETGASWDAQIVPAGAPGECLVWLNGVTTVAAVDGRRAKRGSAGPAGRAGARPSVVAPMPGRVVRVLVAAGDEVAAGQPIVVVEAMKMENELRSPKAGTVKAVLVAEGTPVEAGRVLIVIE